MTAPAVAEALRRERLVVPSGHRLARVPVIAGGLGAVSAAVAFALGVGEPRSFAFSWLVAVLFFLSLALGGLYFVLIHYAMQGGWGIVVRRLAENAMATIPLFALLFVPLVFVLGPLYPWVAPPNADPVLAGKSAYLNVPFFLARAAAYFLCWSAVAITYARLSRKQDTSADPEVSRRLRRWAGPSIIAIGLTQSFAAIDWIMSLDPAWYSTIFGVYWFAGSLVSFFALLTLVTLGLARAGWLEAVVGPEHLHDLGKLLFAFTVFWAYIGFSQYFLIWYGNIPEETVFFRHRLHGSWSAASFLLAAGHFVIPFFYLMPRAVKRNRAALAAGAAWMLAMHLVDVVWLVLPVLHPEGMSFGLVDVASFVAVGGLATAVYVRILVGAPLVPLGDPRLAESLAFENI